MRLLVTWRVKHPGKPKVNVMLVEYDNGLVLNEDKLAQLYDKANNIILYGHNSFGYIWLMYDNTMLKVTRKLMRKTGLELKITISTVSRNLDTMRLMWIEPER
jgi:hypothetical protein